MKPFYKQVIKFLAFLLVTVFLFWLVYRDQNFDDLMKVLRDDVDYTWIWVAIVFGLLSHVSRSLRWQMLTKSMGYRISFMNSFMGVMIGYFANMAIPRMGEFTRCGVVSKYENVPFSKLLGTVVTERVFDMIMLLLLTLVLGVLSVGVAGFFWFVRKGTFFTRLHHFLSGMKEGLLTVKDVKHKWLFIGHTIFIWLMYFLMLYVCFFCFQFTSHLGPMVGLTVFVLSSYGMVAPVQGGVGAWHFMVIAALMIYLPHTEEIASLSKTFALLTHGTMTLLYIVVGVLCLLFLPIYNRK